ncbi:uncharacterized protein BJ212DRAFT_1275930 [Suillus subaureus]|uniref:Uncharacterized protein n=1 Tax=Suillus subaureus TaxID=48587 RepID=A0A9P7JBK1_9AGAM|nr:uncharacterized protein BJ212DRAFT_1275930 [Suillus subaureus]KAG1812877.1 hypothetical protein BJ212DRAFT_1275930 [Suillus subaureus]
MRNLLNKTVERLMKDWTSPIYAFFEPTPGIEYHNGCHCHVFKCTVPGCKHCVWQYLDKKDVKSTGNMCKHVKSCWGQAALQVAMEYGVVKSLLDTRSIQMSFNHKGKGKVVYSHHQHTWTETRFALMKTGWPKYHILSPLTVAHDVKQVFVKTCKQIVQMLQQNYDGELNFVMDAWTSPNHRAYVAVSVHLEHKGQPFSMILDIVKLPKVVVLT